MKTVTTGMFLKCMDIETTQAMHSVRAGGARALVRVCAGSAATRMTFNIEKRVIFSEDEPVPFPCVKMGKLEELKHSRLKHTSTGGVRFCCTTDKTEAHRLSQAKASTPAAHSRPFSTSKAARRRL